MLKTITQITSGIMSIIDKTQAFLTYWEKKYRHVWEADRDAYIRRYEKAQKPLSSFDADISRYLQVRYGLKSAPCWAASPCRGRMARQAGQGVTVPCL